MFSKQLLIVIALNMIRLLALPQKALHAQGWQWQNPLPQGDNLKLVTFVDRDHGWITSDGPILFRTRDGGRNWEILRTSIVFTGIHFINLLEGWGIGNPRLDVNRWSIYHTTDGGATWEVQLADTTARYDIFFLDNMHGWATSNGTIPDVLLFTSDGGKIWELQAQRQFRLTDEIHGITFRNRSRGWAVGGLLWGIRTRDGGKTWERDSSLAGVEQLFYADSLHGWGTTSYRDIVRTSNGGETWERIRVTDAFGEVRINHFFAFDTSRCLVALNIGLYASTDGGRSWAEHAHLELTSFAFLDSLEGWGVAGNKQYHSIDGGRTWQNLTKNILPDDVTFFSSVDFINAQTGWVAGRTQRNDGIILNTRDGGITWTEQWRDNGKQFEQIFFIDDRHGWGVGFDGHIIHTNNGGQRWQIQNSGTDFILRAVAFVDTLHGWVVGERPVDNKGLILHTNDGGKMWFDQTPLGASSLSAVTFLDISQGWVAGKMIFRTKDGGQNWVMQRQGTGLGSVTFVDTLHGWAAGYDPPTGAIIIHTEDGGMTWIPQLAGSYYAPKDMKFVDSLHGWAVSLFGQIYSTSDGGRNWREQQGYTSQWLEAVDFIDTQTGWIVGWHGAILHTKSGGVTSVVQRPVLSSLPFGFELYPNYPNPFNAQTILSFRLYHSQTKVTVAIYNLMGELVTTLLDDRLLAGDHRVIWDGTNQYGKNAGSGIYLHQIRAEEQQRAGKMILLR